jgi:RNA recognition motif-containing protein
MASAKRSGEEEEANAVCAEPKVFVGGLRYDVSQDEVHAHFARFGALRHTVLLKHMDTGKSKGCAMVLFEHWAAAEAAVAAEHGAQMALTAPRPAVVRLADPQRNEHGVLCGVTPKKLFIGQVFVEAWHWPEPSVVASSKCSPQRVSRRRRAGCAPGRLPCLACA